MLSPEHISWFYDRVLGLEEIGYAISHSEIQNAIRNMAKAYKPEKSSWNRQKVGIIADYNDAAHRCAYLHKYAPLHTYLVQDVFHKVLTECYILQNHLFARYDSFNICSLGGGPGTDIIGIISACQPCGLLPYSVQVVDLFSGWQTTFNSLAEAFRVGCYGNLSLNFDAKYLNCSYTAANLLHSMDNKVCKNIGSADLVTMVKFVSAAACKKTENMIKKIFDNMKPGAMVLFIDNAAGGFRQMISRSAEECNLVTIHGPLNHIHYLNPEFNIVRYGYTRCYETKVTVQMLMKLSQPRFTYSDQNLVNPSPNFIPKMSNREANRIVLNSKLSSYSKTSNQTLLSKHPEPPLSEITPLHRNTAKGFSKKGLSQSAGKTYGTDALQNSKTKSEGVQISSASNIQSNKRELYENADQSVGTFSAESFDQLTTAKHFKSQKPYTKLSTNINGDSNSANSFVPSSSTGLKESVNKTLVLNVNDTHTYLPVMQASSKNLNIPAPKKVVPIAPNVKDNCARQPIIHPSSSKVLNKNVIKKTIPLAANVKENPKSEPVLHVSPKSLSSSLPKKVAPVAPYVTREIQSKIVTLPPSVRQETLPPASSQGHPSVQNQTNLAKLFRSILECFCLDKCCAF